MKKLALALVLHACAGSTSETVPLFDPTHPEYDDPAKSWLAYPFPADHRRTEDGTIDLNDFPNPGRSTSINNLTDYASDELGGFSTTAPVYVAFEGGLQVADLPSDIAAFRASDAPLQLVDITAGSPTYGRRWPLRWELFTETGSYVVPNTLAVSPAWGFPLRERTTYAFLMTDAVHGADGARIAPPRLLAALLGDRDLRGALRADTGPELFDRIDAQFAPLRALLDSEGGRARHIVAATVFTTQDVTSELAAIYDWVAAAPAPVADPAGWQELGGAGSNVWWKETVPFSDFPPFQWTRNEEDTVNYWVFEGRFTSPNFQSGSAPYSTGGGGLNFVAGEPVPARNERLRFVLSVPQTPATSFDGCYPIVEYAHGTGGDANSFVDDATAGRLAARGMAGIGLDQPIHAPRSNATELTIGLYTFNYGNPEAARSIFRQSAVDTFSLTRLLRGGLVVPAERSPTGAPICFDGNRLGFFGHSQGGLSGAIAAAFESRIDAWMLSAAGGTLSIALIDRNDTQYLLAKRLLFDESMLPLPSDVLTYSHPVIGLIQTLVDVADPINYSPLWLRGGSPPHSMMLTSGHHDEQTPHRTADALAVAGGLPIVEPIALPIAEYAVAGIPPVESPVSGNVGGETAGFLQWTDDVGGLDADTHFLVFGRREAIHASMHFLQTATQESVPVIERLPDANVR